MECEETTAKASGKVMWADGWASLLLYNSKHKVTKDMGLGKMTQKVARQRIYMNDDRSLRQMTDR